MHLHCVASLFTVKKKKSAFIDVNGKLKIKDIYYNRELSQQKNYLEVGGIYFQNLSFFMLFLMVYTRQ